MKILVKDQCLKTGTDKQQYCIKVALPVWGSFVVYKVEQQSVEREMSSLERWKTKPNVMVAALGYPKHRSCKHLKYQTWIKHFSKLLRNWRSLGMSIHHSLLKVPV